MERAPSNELAVSQILEFPLAQARRWVAAARPKALPMAEGPTIGKLRLPLPPGEQKSQELGTFPTRLTVLLRLGWTVRGLTNLIPHLPQICRAPRLLLCD